MSNAQWDTLSYVLEQLEKATSSSAEEAEASETSWAWGHTSGLKEAADIVRSMRSELLHTELRGKTWPEA